MRNTREMVWMEHIRKVDVFYETKHKLPTIEDDSEQFHWLNNQRKAYRKGGYPEDRAAILATRPWFYCFLDPSGVRWAQACQTAIACAEGKYPPNSEPYRQSVRWLSTQLRSPGVERLTKERKELLLKISDVITPARVREKAWDARMSQLETFYLQHGHLRTYAFDSALCFWVRRQRAALASGTLEPWKRERLEGIGIFHPPHQYENAFQREDDKSWVRHMERMEQYMTEKGNPPTLNEDAELFYWMMTQRRNFDSMVNVEPQRLERLRTAFGSDIFPMQGPNLHRRIGDTEPQASVLTDKWLNRVKNLDTVFEAHGSLSPELLDKATYSWLLKQRQMYKMRTMPEWRREVLDGKPWVGWMGSQQELGWYMALDKVDRFYAQHGRMPKHKDDQYLYHWLKTQRAAIQNGRMTTERTKALQTKPWADCLSAVP